MRLVPESPSPEVYRALQRIKEKTGEKWTPDFLLAAIDDRRAGLFAIRDGETHIAWMVCERIDQGDGVVMNVWALEGEGLEYAERIFLLIDDLARSIGAVSWKCTGRKGWAKWLKPVATVYEREVL